MDITLSLSPHGRLLAVPLPLAQAPLNQPWSERVQQAFAQSQARGLLHLATRELQSALEPEFAFAREFAIRYLTRLCHTPEIANTAEVPPVPVPEPGELAAMVLSAPPMLGLEYLNTDSLLDWWAELDSLVRQTAKESGLGIQDYLRELNPVWRTVGRVTFHLAENKRDPEYPFAFLATYANRLSVHGKVQHLPLGRALQEYAGARNRAALLTLLQPVQQDRKSVV